MAQRRMRRRLSHCCLNLVIQMKTASHYSMEQTTSLMQIPAAGRSLRTRDMIHCPLRYSECTFIFVAMHSCAVCVVCYQAEECVSI